MHRRRPRPRLAAAPALALAAWTTACYTTQPYQPPEAGTASSPAAGARRDRVAVEFPRPTRLHLQSAEGDTGSAEARRLTGTVVEVRGDTVVLRAPTEHGTRLSFTPAGGHVAVNAATVLITPEQEGRFSTQHFSAMRTALLGFGAAAVVGAVAIANNSASGTKGTSKVPMPNVAR